MISAILIANTRGDALISRTYRGDHTRKSMNDALRDVVLRNQEWQRSPVKHNHFLHDNYCFIRAETSNESWLYLMAATQDNSNASLIFETLYRLVNLFTTYFGEFTEDKFKEYSVLAHEIFEEALDFGYPQTLTLDTIKPFVFLEKGAIKDKSKHDEKTIEKAIVKATGQTPWRDPNLKFKKNEVYLDVVESVNVLVSTDGKVLRSDVSGVVHMKTQLSGNPECKLGLNDKLVMNLEKGKIGTNTSRTTGATKKKSIEINDCSFHQCVRLGKFDKDRAITFVPPDGAFELMKYRTTEAVKIPFEVVSPLVKEHSGSRIEFKVTVRSKFEKELTGKDVEVSIPVPKNTASAKVFVEHGKAKYIPNRGALVWKLKKFPGVTSMILGAEVTLTSSVTKQKWTRPPIALKFTIPAFSSSGFEVRYLKVIEQKQKYDTIKWIRYLTTAGNYEYRI